MQLIHSISNARPRKIEVGIRFLFDTGFVQLRENLDVFEKNQGNLGKLREFSDHFYNLRKNSGNFILSNITDPIGGALRINEASK